MCSFFLYYTPPLRESFYHFINLHYSSATTTYVHTILKFCTLWCFDLPFSLPLSYCFSPNVSRIDITIVHYIPVLYPVFLVAVTHICCELHANNVRLIVCLWRPFHKIVYKLRRNWSGSDSIVHAFATFLLLSFSMLVYVSYGLLHTMKVYNTNGTTVSQVVFLEPSIKRYSKDHLPYVTVALVMLFIFGICPAFFLCLYPTRMFRRAMHCCSPRRRLAVDTFMETIQGCYQNGLSGGRDYRIAPALYMFMFLLFILYHSIFSAKYLNGTASFGGAISMIVVTLLLCYFKPSLMNLYITDIPLYYNYTTFNINIFVDSKLFS